MNSEEFCSEIEKLMPAEELFFEPTPAFGEYKPFLLHAIAHPAKANTKLLEFLIEKFTNHGDVVLDPMAGSGSTAVVAALHGRNAVCVELEKRFYEWMEKARLNVEKHPTLTPKGRIVNICGDARRLSELLSRADVAITSPPYAETYTGGGDPEKRKKRLIKAGHNPKDFMGGKARNAVLKHYGEIDAVITSPPYSDAVHGRGLQGRDEYVKKMEEGLDARYRGKVCGNAKLGASLKADYPKNPSNIANLPLGQVDSIITSPPYGEAQEGSGIAKRGYQGSKHSPTDLVGKRSYMPDKFENPENISNLPFVDTVITSPPYERQLHDSAEKRAAGAWNGSELDVQKNLPMGYSENPENIGNLKRETYLEAMLRVYGEMWKVLKPNGLAIIIVKPFIRNKRVVDLPWHTWLLMAKVGFKLEKLYKLRLKQQSFWRILYYKKNSGVPKIAHEYIIITQKPPEA